MESLPFPILLISVLIPIIVSVIMPLIKARPKSLATISFLSLLIPLIVSSYYTSIFKIGEGVVDPIYFKHAVIGSFTMLLDSLSAPLAFSIALVTAMVAIYSLPYMEHRMEEMEKEGVRPQSWGTYYMLYTMFSAAMIGTVLSTNLIEFYIFFELTLIPSFLLIAFYGYGNRIRIAIMYLIWTHIGALLFLLGVLIFGLNTRTFDILNVETMQFNIGLGQQIPPSVLLIALLALTIGLFVKMAVFGVHIWLPYAHAEAPTPVSALLSPNLIGIAGYALIRIVYTLFPESFFSISPYAIALALITMIYGGLVALAQDDFKRLLAYSSISQMGYVLLGVASLTVFGITGAILHYVSHAVGKAILFMVAGILIVQLQGLRSISKMGGLAAKMPITGSLAMIGFMHITGMPPTVGFWSEVLIIFGIVEKALEAGSILFVFTLITLLVAVGISFVYAFITMKRIFFGSISNMIREDAKDGTLSLMITVAIIASIGLSLFFYPNLFIDPLTSFTKFIYGLGGI
jgi:NADH-quinone oxidoreductase subunit M